MNKKDCCPPSLVQMKISFCGGKKVYFQGVNSLVSGSAFPKDFLREIEASKPENQNPFFPQKTNFQGAVIFSFRQVFPVFALWFLCCEVAGWPFLVTTTTTSDPRSSWNLVKFEKMLLVIGINITSGKRQPKMFQVLRHKCVTSAATLFQQLHLMPGWLAISSRWLGYII